MMTARHLVACDHYPKHPVLQERGTSVVRGSDDNILVLSKAGLLAKRTACSVAPGNLD